MQIDERLRTEKITPELIDYIVEKIVREIQPEKIILYGSYARGDFHKDSDVDLFIIKDSEESSRLLRRKVEALLRGRRFPLDIRVRKSSEVEWNFRAQNPFYLYHIFKDGKVLYDKNARIAEGRYPGDLPFESIGENEANEAIEAAEKIEQFVLRKLSDIDQSNSENVNRPSSDTTPPTSK